MEAFCEEMNREAKRIGLNETHFVNPHGLDDSEHYTTAFELALIARALLENDWLATIVSTTKKTIGTDSPEHTRVLINHNRLLRSYDGCIGVKTGYTKRSGRCLVSAAEKNGVRLIAVTLNAPNDWQDHTDLFDYGMTRYRSVRLCERQEHCFEVAVVGGTHSVLTVSNQEALAVTLPRKSVAVNTTVELPRFLYAPISTDQTVGKVVYHADLDGDGISERLGEVALTVCQGVEITPPKSFWQKIVDFFRNIFSF